MQLVEVVRFLLLVSMKLSKESLKRILIWNVGSVENYTAEDFATLFEDANLTLAQEIGPMLIGNLSVKTASPGTNFYGFYGSGRMQNHFHILPSASFLCKGLNVLHLESGVSLAELRSFPRQATIS